jgi:hypothetical protein
MIKLSAHKRLDVLLFSKMQPHVLQIRNANGQITIALPNHLLHALPSPKMLAPEKIANGIVSKANVTTKLKNAHIGQCKVLVSLI